MTGIKMKCYRCGVVFTSDRDAEDAMAEYKANFPDFNEFETVCDPCNEEFWKWMDKAHPEVKRKV